MEYCSYFIREKAIFGSFPDQNSVNILENEGVRYFLDLTFHDEKKIVPYVTNYKYIHFPIHDQNIPDDSLQFCKLIIKVSRYIRNMTAGEKLYIHCKGGHGRSGIVVACILCYIFGLTPYESIKYTSMCHNNRKVMRDRWRKIGSPQTYAQKKFVHKCFHPINFTVFLKKILNDYKVEELFSEKKLHFIGENNDDDEEALNVGEEESSSSNEWDNVKDDELKSIINKIIHENQAITSILLKSYIRPIVITHLEHNIFWRSNGFDVNTFIKMLTSIKINLLINQETMDEK